VDELAVNYGFYWDVDKMWHEDLVVDVDDAAFIIVDDYLVPCYFVKEDAPAVVLDLGIPPGVFA